MAPILATRNRDSVNPEAHNDLQSGDPSRQEDKQRDSPKPPLSSRDSAIIHRSPPHQHSDTAQGVDSVYHPGFVTLSRRNDDESAVIGTVLGVVFFVVFLGVVGYLCVWRKSQAQELESKYGKMRTKKDKKKHKSKKKDKYCDSHGPCCYEYCKDGQCEQWLDQQAYQQALAEQQQDWAEKQAYLDQQQAGIDITVPQAAYGGPTRVLDDGVNEMDAPQIRYDNEGYGWDYSNGWWHYPYNAYRHGRRRHRRYRRRPYRY